MPPAPGPISPVGLHTRIERTADRLPEAVALRFADRQWSFRELDDLANAVAQVLAERGIGPGQRVALMTSSRPEFPVFVQGILKAGASVVMVSPAWKRKELAHAFGLTDPSLVVCDGSTPEAFAGRIGERLASYKRPRSVQVVDAIPRLPSGKVLRRVLRELFTGRGGTTTPREGRRLISCRRGRPRPAAGRRWNRATGEPRWTWDWRARRS